MINGGPYSITLNGTVDVPNNNGNTASGNPPVAVQVCNTTGYTLNLTTAGGVFLCQAFTALTVPSDSGSDLFVQAIAQYMSGAVLADTFTVTWLLAGEQPPQPDGALTAQALASVLLSLSTTSQFVAATGVSCPNAEATLIVNLLSLSYPAGTTLANYNSAYVAVASGGPNTGNIIIILGGGGVTTFQATHALIASTDPGGELYLAVVVPLATGGEPTGGIYLVNNCENEVSATVVFTQEVIPVLGALVY